MSTETPIKFINPKIAKLNGDGSSDDDATSGSGGNNGNGSNTETASGVSADPKIEAERLIALGRWKEVIDLPGAPQEYVNQAKQNLAEAQNLDTSVAIAVTAAVAPIVEKEMRAQHEAAMDYHQGHATADKADAADREFQKERALDRFVHEVTLGKGHLPMATQLQIRERGAEILDSASPEKLQDAVKTLEHPDLVKSVQVDFNLAEAAAIPAPEVSPDNNDHFSNLLKGHSFSFAGSTVTGGTPTGTTHPDLLQHGGAKPAPMAAPPLQKVGVALAVI